MSNKYEFVISAQDKTGQAFACSGIVNLAT